MFKIRKPNKNNWSLRAHVAIACMFLVVFTAFGTGIAFYSNALYGLNERTGYTLNRLSEQVTKRLELGILARGDTAKIFAQIPNILEPSIAQNVVDGLLINDTTIAWAAIADKQGHVVAGSNGILTNTNISNRHVFEEGIKGLHFDDVHEAALLTSLLYPEPLKKPALFVDVSTPIVSSKGETIGVVIIHLNWESVRGFLDSYSRSANEYLTETIILNNKGTVILGPEEIIGKIFQNLPQFKENKYITSTWLDGKTYVSGITTGGLFNWTVILREPQSNVIKYLNSVITYTLVKAVIIALVMSFMGWIAGDYIARPLRHLTIAADRMRNGETDSNLITKGSYKEIQTLSNSLNSLVRSLINQHNQLQVARGEAEHDHLTGLPNRRMLSKYAKTFMGTGDGKMAVICMDLDRFKGVNDTYGHSMGDAVLGVVSDRILSCIRPNDMLARIGGDEFILVISGNEYKNAELISNRIITCLSMPIVLNGSQINIGCSAGIAYWKQGISFDEMVKRADIALYEAKDMGKGITAVFKPVENI